MHARARILTSEPPLFHIHLQTLQSIISRRIAKQVYINMTGSLCTIYVCSPCSHRPDRPSSRRPLYLLADPALPFGNLLPPLSAYSWLSLRVSRVALIPLLAR